MSRCHLISLPPSSFLYSLLLFSWTELRALRTAEVGVGVGEATESGATAGGAADGGGGVWMHQPAKKMSWTHQSSPATAVTRSETTSMHHI
uniref:Secreted protein n=1 Tax=Oryza glumipatula TaxID=40148 RepID=A0A0D9ZWA4_9ORYZ